MIKAIIFDCFGVLVTDGLDLLVQEHRLGAESASQVWGLVDAANKGSINLDSYWSAVANILGISTEEYFESVKNREVKNTQLLNYIEELRPKYRIGLLSNVGSIDSLESRFDKGELEEHFDAIVASGKIGYAKPEAQAYEITADELKVRIDECIMIDDQPGYVDGARGVGMQAILYKSFDQLKTDLAKLLPDIT